MKKVTVTLLSTLSLLCLALGLAACGETEETPPHDHVYTVENTCSVCGDEWNYTKIWSTRSTKRRTPIP